MPSGKLFRSGALRSAIAFAVGGGGFALANVLLARQMAPREFGLVVLFVALTQLGATLGPAGMDTVAVRHRLGPSAHLFMKVLTSATALGGIAAIALLVFFDFSTQLCCLLIVAVVLSALNRMGCSFMQSLEQYRRGLGLMLAHNAVLLGATLILIAVDRVEVEAVAVLLTIGYGITTVFGWMVGRRLLSSHMLRDSVRSYAREGFTIVASQTSTAILNQLDRLLIPRLLSPGALGEYAAAAVLCASPFNLLQSGTRYTLLPKLRNSTSRAHALKLLRNEALAIFSMMVIAGSACFLLAPAVSQWLFHGRYQLGPELVELLVILGVLKVWHSFTAGCVQALGSQRALMTLSVAGWAALAIAIAGMFGAEELELEAIVSAIAFAWFVLCIASTLIAMQGILAPQGARADSAASKVWPTRGSFR